MVPFPTIIFKDNLFTINFPGRDSIILTWEEWMGLRKAQNILIQTEPE